MASPGRGAGLGPDDIDAIYHGGGRAQCRLCQDEVEARYTRPGASTDRLDGLTVSLGDGRWFNLRPSHTEPLLRLNVEAPDHAAMAALRNEVLALVR